VLYKQLAIKVSKGSVTPETEVPVLEEQEGNISAVQGELVLPLVSPENLPVVHVPLPILGAQRPPRFRVGQTVVRRVKPYQLGVIDRIVYSFTDRSQKEIWVKFMNKPTALLYEPSDLVLQTVH